MNPSELYPHSTAPSVSRLSIVIAIASTISEVETEEQLYAVPNKISHVDQPPYYCIIAAKGAKPITSFITSKETVTNIVTALGFFEILSYLPRICLTNHTTLSSAGSRGADKKYGA